MTRKFPKKTFTHALPKSFGGGTYQIGDKGAHFELTPEKLAEAVKQQAELAETVQSPFLNVSPQMSIVNRARRELPDWYESLQQVEIALSIAKRKQKKELHVRRNHFLGLIAESLAILGDFQMAIAVSPKGYKIQRKEWKVLAAALADTDGCDCSIENHVFLATKERVHKEVFDPATGKMRVLVACNVCNKVSAKAPSPELVKHRDARAQAAGLARGKTHAQAHRELRDHGLTAEKVLSLRQ